MPMLNNLSKIRRKLRLSQKELSCLTKLYLPNGIDPTAISKQETGSRDITRVDMYAYSRIFKIPGSYLFSNLIDDVTLYKTLDSEWSMTYDTHNSSIVQPAISGQNR